MSQHRIIKSWRVPRKDKPNQTRSRSLFECGHCGHVFEALTDNGTRQKSCGCLTKCVGHATRRTQVYTAWSNMKARCNRESLPGYGRYGGRGISYCSEWEDFMCFLRDMGEPSDPGLELERLDNNLGYCKSNCSWVTRGEQVKNRECSILIDGKTLMEIAEDEGITYSMTYRKYVLNT